MIVRNANGTIPCENMSSLSLEELKELMLENPARMMGDVWHNQVIELLFDGIEDNVISRNIIQDILARMMMSMSEATRKDENFSSTTLKWYDRILNMNKGDYKLLNSIIKSKTKATLLKRMQRFIDKQYNGHYARLLNQAKITFFTYTFEQILKEVQ